tara:strand:- start:3840 stop:4103 length:264 start_codon:yes stop_codon:yes gene_type:complete
LVKTGTNNTIIKDKKDISIVNDKREDKEFLIFNLFFNNLLNGVIIRVKIIEIKIYNKPRRILNNNKIINAIADNIIIDFTKSCDFIV